MSYGLNEQLKQKRGLPFDGKDNVDFYYDRSAKPKNDKWYKKLMNRRHRRVPIRIDE